MGRIVFLVPHPKALIGGGVKSVYRHAELLEELGFDACVLQPDGRPGWFKSAAKVLTAPSIAVSPGDILVFPENATGWVADMARGKLPARKVLFCWNQHFIFNSVIPAETYAGLGFAGVACTSEIAKGFLARVFGFANAAVIPCFADPAIFFPRPKTMQIAYLPHKLPREARLIRTILALKYPQLASVPFVAIEGKSETETADILGRSAIYLSLASLESFGLTALEAMASRAVVVGFDGYGGKEFATTDNGFWYEPEDVEGVVDRLAAIIDGLERGNSELDAMREAGAATAARYEKSRTRAALAEFYCSMTARVPRA